MENKFCLKSRQELAEIRQAKASVNEDYEKFEVDGTDFSMHKDGNRVQIKATHPYDEQSYHVAKGDITKGVTIFKDGKRILVVKGTKEDIAKKLLQLDKKLESVPTYESKINEISDETRVKAYTKRVQNLQDADKKLNRVMDKKDTLYHMGNYNKVVDAAKEANDLQKKEYKHRLNVLRHDRQFGHNTMKQAEKKLYPNMAKVESLTASKALTMSKSILEGSSLYSDENFEANAKRLKDEYINGDTMGLTDYRNKVSELIKKYGKTEKDYLKAASESKINENDNVKDTMEKLYFFIRVEKEMRNAGEWGKDEVKDKAHKQSISDLFDELDKLGVGFGIQNSLVASAQSSNPDFSKWYAENVAKSESVNEDWKEHDYQYLSVKQALEDIEDEYSREKYLKDFEGLIKRLEYSAKSTDESLEVNEISDELANKVNLIRRTKDTIAQGKAMGAVDTARQLLNNTDFDTYERIKPSLDKAIDDAQEESSVASRKLLRNAKLNSQRNLRKFKAESLAKSTLAKSKELLEGMIDKYGREVDPKEWEEKEAKGLNEVSDELVGKAQRKALDKMKDTNLSREEREKAFKQRFGLDWQKALRSYRKEKQTKSESVVNEISDELIDRAQNKALADVVNPGDDEKKTKGFKHLVNLEKLKQLRDKRKEDLK